jgi:elongator complex protein 4
LTDSCWSDRAVPQQATETISQPSVFCHVFDLTKKLAHPPEAVLEFIRVEPEGVNSPFEAVLQTLSKSIASSSKDAIHRVVLPSLLSPAIYPPQASMPQHVLRFMHGVQAMLAAHAGRLTVMGSLPLSLHPRSSGLVRWIELLNDGVLELAPFPHNANVEISSKSETGASEDPPQGLLRIHRLPILQERGNGTVLTGDDWAFNLSRRRFTIKPFSLPPIEGDIEAQHGPEVQQKSAKVDLEF